MKINRLLEIAIILLNRGTATARELAERFGVSARTIYRDIDVLSSAGVPVITNKGNRGGISLIEGYSLNKAIISERESESLLLALKTLEAAQYPDIGCIIEKLGAVFKNTRAEDWVHVDFSPWGSGAGEHDKFLSIKKSILDRRVIAFDYVGAEGGRSRRCVEPMRLVFKGQAWYLWSYCRMRRDFRLFRISRIKNVLVLEETFERRPDIDGKSEDHGNKRVPATLKLKFSPQALHRVYDDFDDGLIVRNGDGTCIVTASFPEDEWVYGYILSFGSHVEVLEPEHIRRIIAGRLAKALELYLPIFARMT